MERNKDVVACPYDGVRYYLFVHDTTAETGAQLATEYQTVLNGAFGALAEVLVPTEVSLVLRQMPADGTPYGLYESREKLNGEPQYQTITNDSGVTAGDIITEIENTECPDTHIIYPEQIEIMDCSVRCYLQQGWESVTGGSNLYRLYKRGDILDTIPDDPPLSMKIEFWSPSSIRTPEDRNLPCYYCHFTLNSGIWVQETDIGRINHALLGGAFAELSENLNILNKYTRSNLGVPTLSGRLIDQLLEYDGPPVEDLLTKYRRDWIENHLRPQAKPYETEDGIRGVDFGHVTEQINLDELKDRIKTYLDADESTDTIDEIRVRVEDGTELQGTLSAEGIEWTRRS